MQKLYDSYSDLIESSHNGQQSNLEKLSPTKSLWDLVVITAISNDQKLCYETQIEKKLNSKKLPCSFKYKVINDPDDTKIGSGGSTMLVIKQLFDVYKENLFTMKILLIHAGGYSQR
jgi:fucose-1-phosphate guanylyltransferase